MSFISDQIKDSGMYDYLVEQVIDELEALEKQEGELKDRVKQLEKELENAKENLRDRFAAKAMINATGAPTDRAKFAYEIADAMLAERNKGREE